MSNNDKRSSLPCPAIIRNRSRGGASSRRAELKEAAEYSILNERPFTEQPLKSDESPEFIRRIVRDRFIRRIVRNRRRKK